MKPSISSAGIASRVEAALDAGGFFCIPSQISDTSYGIETSIVVTAFENESIEVTRSLKTVFLMADGFPLLRAIVFLIEDVPPLQHGEIGRLLMSINTGIAAGAFSLDAGNNRISFYNSLTVEDQGDPPILEMLNDCKRLVEQHLPGIESACKC